MLEFLQKYGITHHDSHYTIFHFPKWEFRCACRRKYSTSRINHLFKYIDEYSLSSRIRVHEFFIPELIYLLKIFHIAPELVKKLEQETWVKCKHTPAPQRIDMKTLHMKTNIKLLPYQEEFIVNYDKFKHQDDLRGMLLSFEQGLGKTMTAIALSAVLNKELTIIIAPKNTLESVWVSHIEAVYKKPQKVCVLSRPGDVDISADFIILNYEAIAKLKPFFQQLSDLDISIVVDESHNFLRSTSNRTKLLESLINESQCSDVLLMSGTPVKTAGVELIPIFRYIDKHFDDRAEVIFKKAFGVNVSIAKDILNNRLSNMMHRKLKTEVLDLPPKDEETIEISIPNGNEFTLNSVQKKVVQFVKDRYEYHLDRMDEYNRLFDEVIEYARTLNLPEWSHFMSDIKFLRTHKVSTMTHGPLIERVNMYERNVLLPKLPPDLKKQYNSVKSAVKYVNLKIRGEVIGRLLMQLRIQMTTSMVGSIHIDEIIQSATKKTVVFTSYVDTVEATKELLESEYGLKPIAIYGKTMKDVKSLINKFKTDKKANPLIASIKSMSTGVTLTVANTLIFLNKPWRYTDYVQASDRIHRIGQNTRCVIYTILLKTGNEPNLSTRMEDIMAWSKEIFDGVVDGEEITNKASLQRFIKNIPEFKL